MDPVFWLLQPSDARPFPWALYLAWLYVAFHLASLFVAHAKNRSKRWWFLAALVFGPLLTFLVLAAAPAAPSDDRKLGELPDLRQVS